MFRDKLNLALIAGVAICGLMMFPSVSTVRAQDGMATAIELRAQDYSTAISNITFPLAEPDPFRRRDHARSDQAHLPLQHVDELRQFVNAGFAQESA